MVISITGAGKAEIKEQKSEEKSGNDIHKGNRH